MAKPKSLKAKNASKAKSASSKSQKRKSESFPASSDFDESAVIKRLADNERKVREQALKVLGQYISGKRTLDTAKLQKLWKGLFFTVWHSDRPMTQQALVQELADLTKNLGDNNYWTFINAFWDIMSRDWHSIDKHRIDKFLMLVRRYVAAILEKLKRENWSAMWLAQYQESAEKYPCQPDDAKIPHALRLHFFDVILDELEKVKDDDEELPVEQILAPIINFVKTTNFKTVKLYAIENVLRDERLQGWGFVSEWTPSEEVSEDSDSEDDFDKSSEDEEEEEAGSEGSEEEIDDEEFTGFD